MASDRPSNDKPTASATPTAAAFLASLETIAASLSATQEALVDCLDLSVARRNASHRDPSLPHPALRAVSEVVLLLEMNRDRLIDAVKTIPAKAEYAPFSARLREAASGNPALERLLSEAPRLTAPLSDSVPTLMQIADDLLAGRDRLLEAGRGLRLSTALPALPAPPKSEDGERALVPLRELATSVPALIAVTAKLEGLLPALSEAAKRPSAPPEAAGAPLTHEADALAVSLRAVAEIATPLVDTLSDLAHLAAPLAESLRKPQPSPVPPPAPAHTTAGSMDGTAQWAADILKAVRELKESVLHSPRAVGEDERRLWESVRQLQTEIVNLQGALLSPPKPL